MSENNLIEVLDAIGEKLKELKNEIYFKDIQIAELKEALDSAEKQIIQLSVENARKGNENGKEV